MNAASVKLNIAGLAGVMEALRDEPRAAPPKGTVFVAHPHPLFGGSMDNKVVQTIARAFVHCGWRSLRFNFRGVGRSAGVYDEGRGECDDLLAAIDECAPTGALALAGFSFGSFVASSAVERIHGLRPLSSLVLVGAAVSRFAVAAIPTDLHPKTLLIHGEVDDTVPLADVLQWARPQSLPVSVVPGAAHFFHGQLHTLRYLVARHLSPGS